MVEAMEIETEFQKTEVGEIPIDWKVIPISEITAMMTNGFVGTVKSHYTDFDNGVLYIQGYNVEENSFNFNGIKRVTNEFHNKHLKSCLQEGDLLTIQTGDIGITTVVPKELKGANCHALIITRFKKGEADPKFFSYYFNSSYGRRRLKEIETGSTMKHINVGHMINLLIPYPEPGEQTAIATALNDADKQISELEKLIAKKGNIRQGAMQELLRPKDGWVEKTLGEIADVVGGGTPSTFNSKYWNGEINWFTPTEIGDKKYSFHSVRKITREGLKNCSARILPIGTILLTSRASIGDASILMQEGCTNQGFQSLIVKDENNNEFLYYLILTLKPALIQKSSGSTFLEISPSKLKAIDITIPKPTEQKQIAQILLDIDAEIEVLEKKLEKHKMLKQGMMQNLLTGKIRLV
jgi:type I restriction enzyme S subunit